MSWEFQGPLIKDWLAKSLMFGGMLPLGGRSSAGAMRGNDYVRANQMEQNMRQPGVARTGLDPNKPWVQYDPGITGGGPNVPLGWLRSADGIATRQHYPAYGPPVPVLREGVVRAANPHEMRFSGRSPANDK